MAVIGQMTLHKPTPMKQVRDYPQKPGEYYVYNADESGQPGILLGCPFCGKICRICAPTWKLVSIDPLTILPSILQPGACHYHITAGIAVPEQDSKSPA